MRNGICLQVNVGEAILPEHLDRPVAGLLQEWRPGQPRADSIREVFEIVHQFTVIMDFCENLGIRRSDRIPFFCRGSGGPYPCCNESDQQERDTEFTTELHSALREFRHVGIP